MPCRAKTTDRIGALPNRALRYERVYLPLREVADTPFHIQEDEILGTLRAHRWNH